MTKKRIVYRVHYDRAGKFWRTTWVSLDGYVNEMPAKATKDWAVYYAVEEARARWRVNGERTQVIVKNKNGRIAKGGHGERTYGKDPRRSKG